PKGTQEILKSLVGKKRFFCALMVDIPAKPRPILSCSVLEVFQKSQGGRDIQHEFHFRIVIHSSSSFLPLGRLPSSEPRSRRLGEHGFVLSRRLSSLHLFDIL